MNGGMDSQRRERVRQLGELVAGRMPDAILEGSDERFDAAVRALEFSTLGDVVEDAIAFSELPDPHVDPDEEDEVPWEPLDAAWPDPLQDPDAGDAGARRLT